MIGRLALIAAGGMLPILAVAHVHTVQMKPDQILYVKTAIGIATIIETPDAIQSAIIGDQSGFKIEYLDRAVTIKPLRASAKSNLYLQTATRRYDLRLETTKQESADYILYLKSAGAIEPTAWRDVSRSVNGKNLKLTCRRIARMPQGLLLLELKLTAQEKETLKPENFWLMQGKDSKVINGLYLSRLDISKDHPVMLGITIAKSDLSQNLGADILLKHGQESLKIELTADMLWK